MKHLLLSILLVFVFLSGNAQTWESLTFDNEIPGLQENPLKGFVDLFNPANQFPRSINAKLFRMDSIMFGIDNFNWGIIDTFLSESTAEGNHTYLQVNIDPGGGESYLPSYLDGLVEFEYYQGQVVDSCPDWNNVHLMDAMLNFIDAFGTKYNDDPRVFMIHLGLYGIYGEWHIGDVENVRPEFVMTPENKTLLADAYKAAFPDKILLARYPENMPNPQDYGYSDGLFFTQSISDSEYDNSYFHYTLRNYGADLNWKNTPIGGEIDPCIQDTLWKSWPNVTEVPCGDNMQMTDIQDVQQSFDSIHPTWLFTHHIFDGLGDNTTDEWANAITANKLMGYTFYVDEYRLSSENGNPTFEVNFQNTGLAPFYGDWEVEFAVINAVDELQTIGKTNWNLPLIQPDVTDNYRSFTSDSTLVDGPYEFLMRVVNPLEEFSSNAKSLTFANETQDINVAGWLTLGEETIVSGFAGVTPIHVSGISLSQTTAILEVGDDLQLSAIVLPANATEDGLTWVSDQPRTASVSETGYVTTGPAYGNATITAYTHDGNFIATCDINVEPLRVDIPAIIQAQDYVRMVGIVTQNGGSGQHLGFIDDRDWMEYGVIVTSPAIFTADYIYSNKYQDSEISLINEDGVILANTLLPKSGEWFEWDTITSDPILLPAGEYNLVVEAKKGGFNLDWIEFKSDIPLLSSYTFTGTTDNKYIDDTNWDGGRRPPNGYTGVITIDADCVMPVESSLLLMPMGEIIINQNVTFELK